MSGESWFYGFGALWFIGFIGALLLGSGSITAALGEGLLLPLALFLPVLALVVLALPFYIMLWLYRAIRGIE